MITPLGRAKNNLELCTEDFNCEDILYDMPKDIKDSNLNISFEYAIVKKDEQLVRPVIYIKNRKG